MKKNIYKFDLITFEVTENLTDITSEKSVVEKKLSKLQQMNILSILLYLGL